jgi:hypothetical protein
MFLFTSPEQVCAVSGLKQLLAEMTLTVTEKRKTNHSQEDAMLIAQHLLSSI